MVPGKEKSFSIGKNDSGQGKIILHREKSLRPMNNHALVCNIHGRLNISFNFIVVFVGFDFIGKYPCLLQQIKHPFIFFIIIIRLEKI